MLKINSFIQSAVKVNSEERPTIPKPTTLIPMTDPPAKATPRAELRLVLAACVVRLLAAVATRMTKKTSKNHYKEQPTIKLD